MKRNYQLLSLLGLCLILTSCNGNKEALLDAFREIYGLIHQDKYDAVVEKLDYKSVEYVEFLADTTNLDFNAVMTFGKLYKLPLFTSMYVHHANEVIKENPGDKTTLLRYCGLAGVPVFNIMNKPVLLKDKTKTGRQNYVTIGNRVNDNAMITTKVHFTKDGKGGYKFDLLGLIKYQERILSQSFNRYKRIVGRPKGATQTERDVALFQGFLEDRANLYPDKIWYKTN